MSCWKYRRLTLLGKITVLKSLAASQLVYLLSPLRSNHHARKEINDMFYHFLWNGKGDKIKRKVMINEPEYGGLKMIDLYLFIYNNFICNNQYKKAAIREELNPHVR